MQIKIEEDGLYYALNEIKEYLANALNSGNKKIKNEYISKAYGAVIAINQIATIEEDFVDQVENTN